MLMIAPYEDKQGMDGSDKKVTGKLREIYLGSFIRNSTLTIFWFISHPAKRKMSKEEHLIKFIS